MEISYGRFTETQDGDAGKSSRTKWGSQLEFILTSVGCAVGMGNVWRFPYLTYRNGGGVFLIPYFLSLFLLAIPIFTLEVTMGQFSSLGPLKIWKMNPFFKGLGISMVTFTIILMSYYSIIIAQFIFFLFASMTSELPWGSCTNEWNTCDCRLDQNDTSYLNNTHLNCTRPTGSFQPKTGSEEYYNNYVLGASSGIDQPGDIRWQLMLCNLLSWTIAAIILIKGVKTLGKAIYFFTILPYILLTVLLGWGMTLEGAQQGVDYYIHPNMTRLEDASVWGDAAVQIFFSTSTCSGALIAMASYNKFKNFILRDGILIPIINCLTSFYAGFVIFSVLGFMAHNKGTTIDEVTDQGPGLVFVVYPEALSRMPVAPLWAILFFIMMMSLGISSLTSGVESILTAIADEFPVLREGWRSVVYRISVCFTFFVIGLAQVTQGGSYLLNLLDTFLSGFPLLFIGLLEIITFVYIYGLGRLTDDLKMMVGSGWSFSILYYGYYIWTWTVVSPVLLVVIIVFVSLQYEPITTQGYPEWAESLGWLVVAAIFVSIPAWWIFYYCFKGGFRLLRKLNRPQPGWGPMNEENRTGRYDPDGPFSEDSTDNGIAMSVQNSYDGHGIRNLGYVPHKEG